MNTPVNSRQYETLKIFLQELLLQATCTEEVDVLVELLLTIQSTNEETPDDLGNEDPDSTFDIFRLSPRGSVWIGAIKGIDQAKKVLLCLHASQGVAFFLYDTSARNVVDLLGAWTDRIDASVLLN